MEITRTPIVAGNKVATPIADIPQPSLGRAPIPLSVQPFDGTGSWTDYQRQFEITARYAGWTIREKANALAMQLRGEALSVLSALPGDTDPDYEALVSLLRQRFCENSRSSYTQLRSRVQGPKENYAEFALGLQRLVASALPGCPPDVVQDVIVSQFIEGLRDESIQDLITVGRPATLNDAVSLAQELSSRPKRRRVFLVDNKPTTATTRRADAVPKN